MCDCEEGRSFPSILCFHTVGLSSLFLLFRRLLILLSENNSKLIVLQLCSSSEDSGWKATLSIYWFQLSEEKWVKLKLRLAAYYLLYILFCVFLHSFGHLWDVLKSFLMCTWSCCLSVGGTSVRFRPHWFLNCGVLWNLVFGFLGRSEAKECPSCEQEVHSFSQQWKMLPVSTMPNI